MSSGSISGWGSELPHLIRQSARYLPSRLVPALLGFLTIPLLARSLSPTEFGSYSLVAAALPYASVLAGDWLVSGYQRQAQRRIASEEAQALTWLLIFSTLATMLLGIVALTAESAEALGVGLMLVPFLLLRLQWIQLQMRERASTYSWLQVAYSALRLVALGGVAILSARVDLVVLAWVLVTWIIVLAGPRLPAPRKPARKALTQLAAIGVPLVGVSLTINFAATADRFVIAAVLGREATGIYSLGYIVGESLLMMPVSVVYLAAYAITMRVWDEGNKDASLAFVRRLIHVQLAIVTVLALGIASTGRHIVSLVGGPAYASADAVVASVAGAQVAAGIPAYLILIATLRHEARRTLWPSVAACLLNVTITIPAVMIAGIQGAAVTTTITYLVYALLMLRAVEVKLIARPHVVAMALGTLAPALVGLDSPVLLVLGWVSGVVAVSILLLTLSTRKATA